ncbi:hypothetical protein KKA33_01090 [Patescibacteria group bacterium]|nr:hypothetical protein [Patescibacteria group bacterium]
MKNRTLKIIIATLLLVALFLPFSTFAQDTTQTVLGEVSTFGEFISLVWNYGSQVIIALAVFLIVLGAFFYVASGGNDERISQGRQMIFGSLIAILIVIFSGILVRTLHKPAEGTTGYLTDVPNVISNATTILVGLIGAFSVLMLVYAGYLYITARGDADKVSKAHASIRYAIFGLVIGLVAYAAVSTVINYFL